MIILQRHLIIGKVSGAADYSVLWPRNISETNADIGLVKEWLQLHIVGGNKKTAFIVKSSDKLILMKARFEERVDYAGRPIPKMICCSTEKNIDISLLPKLLLWWYRQEFENDTPPEIIELDPEELFDDSRPLDEEQVNCGIAIFATKSSSFCVVNSTLNMRQILMFWGWDHLDYLALAANRIPHMPVSKTGVILSSSPHRSPEYITSFVKNGLSPSEFRLNELYDWSQSNERRVRLFSAIQNSDFSNFEGLEDNEINWMFSINAIRHFAVKYANSDQLKSLSEKLAYEDLKQIDDERLAQLSSLKVAQMMAGKAEHLDDFLRVFKPGASGIELLLPSDYAGKWHAFIGGNDSLIDLDLKEGDIDMFWRVGLLQKLPLKYIASLRTVIPVKHLDNLFTEKLSQMLPEQLTESLISGTELKSVPLIDPPECSPSDFISSVKFDFLLNSLIILTTDQKWRLWWLECLQTHAKADVKQIPSLNSNWSLATYHWMKGALKDAEINKQQLLRRLGELLSQGEMIDKKQLVDLISISGISRCEEITAVIQGTAINQQRFDDELMQEIRYLFQLGVVSVEDLVASVENGSDIRLLTVEEKYKPAVSIVIPGGPHQGAPPVDWLPILSVKLSEAVRQTEFWLRWPGGMTEEFAVWMQGAVNNSASQQLVAMFIQALRHEKVMSIELFQLTGRSLPEHTIVWHLVEYYRSANDTARNCISRALENGYLRDDLNKFLHSLLLELAPYSWPDGLKSLELLYMLPLLDARNCIRYVISQTDIDEYNEKILLQGLMKELAQKQDLLPLPAIDEKKIQRRPEWAFELSKLPGWEHWGEVINYNSSGS